jgi:hypothetical protein
MSDDRPIEHYLDRLERLLPGRDREELIAELRDHLLESAARLREQGLAAHDAELLAIARLGDAETLARFHGARPWARPWLGRVAAATAAAIVVTALGAAALHPLGNDHGLAGRLGLQPHGANEPSGVEVGGVPLPRGVSPADVEARRLRARMAVLDG